MIKGINKKHTEYLNNQLSEWVKGNSMCDGVNECCPDFSCCRPDFLQPKKIRETFAAAVHSGNEAVKHNMLMSFLNNSMTTYVNEVQGSKTDIYTIGEQKFEQN